MTEDRLLFAAALANPAEDTPRLVLADWFDEHDEPELAAALRLGREMVAFLGELTRWDVSPACPTQVYENGAWRELFAPLPAAELLTRYIDLFPVPPGGRTEFDVGAPPPRAYGDPLPPLPFLTRWQHEHGREIDRMRERAARAAHAGVPAPAFEQNPNPRQFEEQSCLLHELVLRCPDVSNVPHVPGTKEHHARMRDRGHPLAWLPLRLLGVEAELGQCLPHFGSGSGAGFNNPTGGTPLTVLAVGPDAPAVVGVEEFAPESQAFAPVRWWSGSNGTAEAAAFRLDRALDPAAVGRLWFSRLPVASLNAALVAPNWFVNHVTAAGGLAHLFAAAHNGGAYSGREWGAYGRLHAFQSLGALIGCDPTASAEEIAEEAEWCEWLSFGGTDWFYDLVDLGLICVRPDRRTVALLAATDTD